MSDFFLRVLEVTCDERMASMMFCLSSPLRRLVFFVTAIAPVGTAGQKAEIPARDFTLCYHD